MDTKENRPELLAAFTTVALVIAVYAMNGLLASTIEVVRIWKQPDIHQSLIREGERLEFLADRVAALEKRTESLSGLEDRVRAVMKEADRSHQALFDRVEAIDHKSRDVLRTLPAVDCDMGPTIAVTISAAGNLVPVKTLQPPPGWSFRLDQDQNPTWEKAP